MTKPSSPKREPPQAASVALSKRRDFRLGAATVRPSLRMVEGPLGSCKGEPRVIQVLIALADARGAVLSREDLLQLCWDGRLVGDDAINRSVAEVRKIAAAVGGGFEVETVPRVGYRISGLDWGSDAVPAAPLATASRLPRRALIAAGLVGIAGLAGGATILTYRRRDTGADALVERGSALQAIGGSANLRRAAPYFREAVRRDPSRADAWGWLAVVLPDADEAREAAQRALSLDAAEPNARAVLAYQQRDLGAWTAWEDALLGVLADAPRNGFALKQLTFFYQGMGRCRDSWRINEQACAVEPFNSGHQHRRAIKHWLFGRTADADKVADQALRLWPREPAVWNARMIIYAFTERAPAALALLEDAPSRPVNLTEPSIASWRAALQAIATRSARDVDRALDICTRAASLAPGLAANAIMAFSYLGELDAAYRVAEGLLRARGPVVQRSRGGEGAGDLYSAAAWGRTQFLFIPATARFRADDRFPQLCDQIGHVAYWRKRGIWPDPFVRGALNPADLA